MGMRMGGGDGGDGRGKDVATVAAAAFRRTP